MLLNIAPDLWQALCRTAAQYPTCTLHLHQHKGWVKSFTVEHGPELSEGQSAQAGCGAGSDPMVYGCVLQQSA